MEIRREIGIDLVDLVEDYRDEIIKILKGEVVDEQSLFELEDDLFKDIHYREAFDIPITYEYVKGIIERLKAIRSGNNR